VFLFAMVILPLGVAIAIRPAVLPDLDPIAGIIEIDTSEPYTGFDFSFLSWDGTISCEIKHTIEPE
jgi:hypothetical protein